MPVVPDTIVLTIAEQAAALAETIRDEPLGVVLAAEFQLPSTSESPLANLMTDALRESLGTDIAIHNVLGGIRSGLPAGPLTFGGVYKMFPFDNRVVIVNLSGREVRDIIASQARKGHRRAGFSGMTVFVSCNNDVMDITLQLDDGRKLTDADRVTMLANDFLTLGGDDVLTPVIPDDGFAIDESMPLIRDLLVDWFRGQSGQLSPDEFAKYCQPALESTGQRSRHLSFVASSAALLAQTLGFIAGVTVV